MDLFSELITAVQSDLTIDGNSTLYPLATVKLAINRAYRKAGGLFRWSETEDAKKTSSVSSQEYYDYPQNWQPDSVWKLKVDDVDYGDPIVFRDYLFEKENNYPAGLTKMWTSQWRRFFIYPTPTSNGNNNICVWGQKVVDAMVNNTDTTIFSYSMPECNDAVVMEAVAILKNKGELQQPVARSFIGGTQLLNFEAQNILSTAFNKIRQNQVKYEKTTPMFDVPDFFATRNSAKNKIGDF